MYNTVFNICKKKLAIGIFILLNQVCLVSQVQIGTDINGDSEFDLFGWSTSMNETGTRIVVGAIGNSSITDNIGQIKVFEEIADNWVQLGTNIEGDSNADLFGFSVSMSDDGNRIAVGARSNDNGGLEAGQVKVLEYDGSDWIQIGTDINGLATNDQLGTSVGLSANGNRLVTGAVGSSAGLSVAGQVRVFEFIAGNWVQVGNSINGDESFSQFGSACSISNDGNTIATSAPLYSGILGLSAGLVRVYTLIGGVWTQVGSDLLGEESFGTYGFSISLSADGSRLAVGMRYDDGGNTLGRVQIYDFDGTNWIQSGNNIEGDASNSLTDHAVSLSSDGSRVAFGAGGSNAGGALSGQTRVYEQVGLVWSQFGNDINGDAEFDQSGTNVFLSPDGHRVSIGAPFNDVNGLNSGKVKVFEFKCAGEVGWIRK